MADRTLKRGRGQGPNAVKGFELLQQARLDTVETTDEEQEQAIAQLQEEFQEALARIDELEQNESAGTPPA